MDVSVITIKDVDVGDLIIRDFRMPDRNGKKSINFKNPINFKNHINYREIMFVTHVDTNSFSYYWISMDVTEQGQTDRMCGSSSADRFSMNPDYEIGCKCIKLYKARKA